MAKKWGKFHTAVRVRLTEQTVESLQQRSARENKPVATLVRDAVDLLLQTRSVRQAAPGWVEDIDTGVWFKVSDPGVVVNFGGPAASEVSS